MAEQKNDPPKFSFGAPSGGSASNPFAAATGSGSGGNLFGSGSSTPKALGSNAPATTSATSLFGSTSTASGGSQPSLFGAASTGGNGSKPFGGFSLAGNSSSASTTPGQTSTTGLFATPNKSADSAASSGGGAGLFGNTSSSGTLFGGGAQGASSATTPAQTKTSGFSFNNPSTTPAGNPPSSGGGSAGLFGNVGKPPQSGTSLFGNLGSTSASTSAPSAPQTSTAPVANTTAPTASLFGSAGQSISNTTQGTSSPFGGAASTGGAPNIFSGMNKPQSTQPESSKSEAPGLFTKPASTQAASTSIFGGVAPGNAGGSKPATPTSFGNTPVSQSGALAAPAAPAQVSAASLFGNKGAAEGATSSSAAPSQPATTSLFGNATASTNSASTSLFAPSASAAASSAAPPSVAAPAPSFFSTKPAASSAGTSGGAPPSLFGAAPPSSSAVSSDPATASTAAITQAAAPSLFGGAQSQSTSTTAQPAGQPATNSEEAYKPTGLGASTTGPKPNTASRLKNKSMDEIVTRWATDLTKYQKEFQSHAATVAKWDHDLVENSDKITKLYGHTLEAERATVEVERQLTAVENDQAELEYWLENYEAQVNELLSSQVGQGDTLSGPDQERERTYKLAERLADRLDEMNKDLTSMVEEINDASSHLNKNSKADDPLSQIVRVLNGHLMQLQQIDQGAAALQTKVKEAQKASRQIGSSNGGSVLGNDAADDFYRSYMGRR